MIRRVDQSVLKGLGAGHNFIPQYIHNNAARNVAGKYTLAQQPSNPFYG